MHSSDASPCGEDGGGDVARSGARSRPIVPDDLPIGGRVSGLTPSARDAERITIKVGGRSAGTLPGEQVRALGLRVGMVWTEEADAAFRQAVLRDGARRYALASASRRGVSRARLARALAQRGYPAGLVDGTLDDLERLGVLDDRGLGESVARGLLARSGIGARLIEQKLILRGIGRELAREIAGQACAGRDPVDDALALARKKLRAGTRTDDRAGTRRRIYGALARRGFDAEVCRIATERALGGSGADDEPIDQRGAGDDG